jgi:hypothetical protein
MGVGLTIFTLVHVAISLLGIASGFVVIGGMLSAKRFDGWTKFFLTTTVLTSATGFGFPVDRFMPSHAVGILSLLVLSVAIYARYARHMVGAWRWIYVVGAVVAQYLNFFVLIVQSFQKIPPLHALAPTQSEPQFAITQLVFLVMFLVLGILAVIRFRPGTPSLL